MNTISIEDAMLLRKNIKWMMYNSPKEKPDALSWLSILQVTFLPSSFLPQWPWKTEAQILQQS